VAYSTPQVVYDEVIPAFAKTPEGRDVASRPPSARPGEQSRAVEAGLAGPMSCPFSIEPDIERLVKAGLVAKSWQEAPHDGLVTTSVVSFIVRKGNPKTSGPGTTCSSPEWRS
jgi:sulfate transport system substrate-binding protein